MYPVDNLQMNMKSILWCKGQVQGDGEQTSDSVLQKILFEPFAAIYRKVKRGIGVAIHLFDQRESHLCEAPIWFSL